MVHLGGYTVKINGKTFDNPDAILSSDKVSQEKTELIQLLYRHYVSLRYIARGNGCNKASYLMVYNKLQEPEVFERVHEQFGYTKDEMNERLQLARKYIPMIK